jgi:hypothetical protein
MGRPAEGIALGVWVPGLPEASVLDRYTELTGHLPAIVHWWSNWQRSSRNFDTVAAEAIRRRGAIPMISWEPWHGLAAINRGELDGYARDFARSIVAYGGPLLLRFGHEMNGRWITWGDDAAAYRSAWRRLRRILADEGARQAAWVWSPHVVDRNAGRFESYYPGDDEVDWLALDGYNWGRTGRGRRWQTFDQIFASGYEAIIALSPSKPLMLAEIGCAEEGGDKAAWIRDAFLEAIPDRYPAVRAVVWFNEDKQGHADWRVESSSASLAAWRDVVADPRYAPTGERLPQGTT